MLCILFMYYIQHKSFEIAHFPDMDMRVIKSRHQCFSPGIDDAFAGKCRIFYIDDIYQCCRPACLRQRHRVRWAARLACSRCHSNCQFQRRSCCVQSPILPRARARISRISIPVLPASPYSRLGAKARATMPPSPVISPRAWRCQQR